MSQPKATFKASAVPDTTLRRLRVAPSYFFIVWRWSMWLYALIVILNYYDPEFTSPVFRTNVILLVITLLQTLAATFVPIFQLFIPRRMPRLLRRLQRTPDRQSNEDEEITFLKPLVQTRSLYWDLLIYGLDLLICGVATYYGGPCGIPPFGAGSPFYRYGLSTILAAAMAFRYRGGLAAACMYDLFIVIGIVFPAPGALPYQPNIVDIAGSLIDAPLTALLAAYIATLIANYARSKKREQTNVRRQKALLSVSEAIMSEVGDRERLLRKTAKQLQHGGHFQRLVIALVGSAGEEGKNTPSLETLIETCIETNIAGTPLPARNPAYIEQVLRTGQQLSSFEYFYTNQSGNSGIARLYLPLFKEQHVQMIIGAESQRQTPFDRKSEEFITIAGGQLLIALDNMRLAEQTLQLAATAERGRIAREIHDGIAQLTYMLSLNAETCATQAHRIAEASEEDAELLTPLAQRLDKLVIVSKQALWETRNYMFSLRPMMSGETSLAQMLTNQVHEFQTISDLPVDLEIEGEEQTGNRESRHADKQAQVGAAIFRIVQEALTNAYKHAGATRLQVHLRHLPDQVEVTVRDNGHGWLHGQDEYSAEDQPRIYSGHGLRGMRERAEELGGSFEIAEQPAGGFQVRICIPL